MKYFPAHLLLLIPLGLAGCATGMGQQGAETRPMLAQPEIQIRPGDDGVVVAETTVMGRIAPDSLSQTDCATSAVNVKVSSLKGDSTYQFDADGGECAEAEMLFDGSTPAGSRPNAPEVKISFRDQLGPVPPVEEMKVQTITVPPVRAVDNISATTPEEMAQTAAPKNKEALADITASNLEALARETQPSTQPKLEDTISAWQGSSERKQILADSEKFLADTRDLSRLSSAELLKAHQEKIEDLMARLREAERVAQLEQQRASLTKANLAAERERGETEAMRLKNEKENLRTDITQLQDRLAKFDSMNKDLSSSAAKKEKMYMERISKLSGDLAIAEKQADAGRRQLVLQAAQKIAEAERIAYAARMAQTEAKTAEADRLKQEGEQLMQRALDLQQGKTFVVKGMENLAPAAAAPVPLEKAPVVVEAHENTLEQIVKQVFDSAKDTAGTWRVVWEISGQHQGILKETWSMAAEASFEEVMSTIAAQVKAASNIQLTFSRFDKSRLFVISDQ